MVIFSRPTTLTLVDQHYLTSFVVCLNRLHEAATFGHAITGALITMFGAETKWTMIAIDSMAARGNITPTLLAGKALISPREPFHHPP